MLVSTVLVALLLRIRSLPKIAQNRAPRSAILQWLAPPLRLCAPRNGGKDVQLDRAADCFCQLECVDRLKQGGTGSFCRGLCRSAEIVDIHL